MRGMRRVEALENEDYDHQISLVDDELGNEEVGGAVPDPFWSALAVTSSASPKMTSSPESATTNQALLERPEQEARNASAVDLYPVSDEPTLDTVEPFSPYTHDHGTASSMPREITGPSEDRLHSRKRRHSAESFLDVLYENQRGCIFCGIPLFSSKALGPLDPSAWTNGFDKASPTTIKTAQPPNPSWEWIDSAWWTNRTKPVDREGWTYSFAFAKSFSWHRPWWWNSFVRRRDWFRRRIKVHASHDAENPLSLIQFDGSAVYPALEPSSSSRNRPVSTIETGSAVLTSIDVPDFDALLTILRRSRIDRENIEVIESFMSNSDHHDCALQLARLSAEVPRLMGRLVFQASREMLLARLTRARDEVAGQLQSGESADREGLLAKLRPLEDAVRSGEEEMRRATFGVDE